VQARLLPGAASSVSVFRHALLDTSDEVAGSCKPARMYGKPLEPGSRTVGHSVRVCRAYFWLQMPPFLDRRSDDGNLLIPDTLRHPSLRTPQDIFDGFLQRSGRGVPALSTYAYQKASSLVLAHYGSAACTESRLGAAGLCGALHCRSPGDSWVLAASLRITTDSASSALD
jgi:hypothetical protein